MESSWRDDEQMSDGDAELAIREYLMAARRIAAKRRWYGITEGIDQIAEIMEQQ